MRYAFIGAGKVGVTLGKYLSDSKECILAGYYSRRTESAMKAANFTQSICFTDMGELIQSSDAIFLTVPDGVISLVYEELCHYDISGKQIIHCSGSLSSNVFEQIHEHQAFGLSIHPLYAFSQPYGDHSALSQAVITMESYGEKENEILSFWKGIFQKKGNDVVFINSDNKTKYHCAAVLCSNLVLGLLNCGVSMLAECGFSQEEALAAIQPLTINNLSKAFASNLSDALTGPIERADEKTIQKHLDNIEGETKQIYELLSKQAVKLAKEKNPERDYTKIEELL